MPIEQDTFLCLVLVQPRKTGKCFNTEPFIRFFEQLGMLTTPLSFIWVLQMLIGYSTFLINIYFGILVFSIGYFCKC